MDMDDDDDTMMMDDAMGMAMGASTSSAFCGGPATTMQMAGFTSSLRRAVWSRFFGTTPQKKVECLNLFFQDWTLDTEAKFLWGCAGVFGLACLVEAVGCLRRCRTYAHRASRAACGCVKKSTPFGGGGAGSALEVVEAGALYGAQLTLGYFLMLAVMTYSSELFAAAVLGIACANVAFRLVERRLAASRRRRKRSAGRPSSPSEERRSTTRVVFERLHAGAAGTCCASALAHDEYRRLEDDDDDEEEEEERAPMHRATRPPREDDPETATPAPQGEEDDDGVRRACGAFGLKVAGMTCESCVDTVHNAVLDVPGVAAVRARLDAGRVIVFGSAPILAVAKAIEDAGFGCLGSVPSTACGCACADHGGGADDQRGAGSSSSSSGGGGTTTRVLLTTTTTTTTTTRPSENRRGASDGASGGDHLCGDSLRGTVNLPPV